MNKCKFDCSPSKFQFQAALALLTLLIIKLLFVFYATSRDIGLSFPYDSMVFMQEHRFTDWLIPIAYSKLNNPFDLTDVLYTQLPPAPYSILTFWLLRLTNYIGVYQLFFIVLSIIVLLNYKIGATIVNKNDNKYYPLAYLSMLVSAYPLYFLVDRGNTEIFGVLAVSVFFYNIYYIKNPLVEVLAVATLASLKPSWALYTLVFVFFKPMYFALASAIVSFVYFYPVIFLGNGINYLYDLIVKNLPIMVGVTTFCNNFTCAWRVFFPPSQILDYAFAALVVLFLIVFLIFMWYRKKKLVGNSDIVPIAFIAVTIVTLLVNNPSPDYRLPILFPVFIYLVNNFNGCKKYLYVTTLISFVLIFGFYNIPLRNFPPYYTVLRFVGVLLMILPFRLIICGKIANQNYPNNI